MTAAAPEPARVRVEPMTWAREVLVDQEMPQDEIAAVLFTSEPETIHRYMELHAERLEERLAEQMCVLAEVERVIAEAASARTRVA